MIDRLAFDAFVKLPESALLTQGCDVDLIGTVGAAADSNRTRAPSSFSPPKPKSPLFAQTISRVPFQLIAYPLGSY